MSQSTIFVPTAQLPGTLASALHAIGYRKPDIRVDAAETYHLAVGTCAGQRAYAAIVDLATGRYEVMRGNWGGSNMFTTTPVDDDTSTRPIPLGCAIVVGNEGHGPTTASVRVHPANLAPLIPAAAELSGLSERERRILATFKGYTSAGRKRAFESEHVHQGEIDRLVTLGLVKRASNGACSITTAGKNAIGGARTL